MQIGADIHYMNDDENHYAIYIGNYTTVFVTKQLTKLIPVYKEGVAVYNNNFVALLFTCFYVF